MAELRLGTLNIGGMLSPAKRKKILLYLKKSKLDIVYLQETHLLPPEVAKLGSLGWKVLASASFSSKARGVVILVKAASDIVIHSTVSDPQGRFTIADVTINGYRSVLCNLYAPNLYSKDFFLQILNELSSFGDFPLLLGGDFNLVVSPTMDRRDLRRSMSRTQKIGIPYILKQLHLLDVWRAMHPQERDFSCLSSAHASLSRINYILAPVSFFPRVQEGHIELICLSDQALCWVSTLLQIDRGPYRQWRFPSHLSQSVKFQEVLVTSWESLLITRNMLIPLRYRFGRPLRQYCVVIFFLIPFKEISNSEACILSFKRN